MGKMKIGEVAKKTNVGIETIRFYERRGLIPSPSRSSGGYRQYPEDIVKRIQFIKNAKELGFSLKEISELFSLRVKSKTKCGDIKKRAEAKIADMDERIKTLQRMKGALQKLASQCRGTGPVGDCPILENFNSTVGE